MKPKINCIETADGSLSLAVPELKETYHSKHGARQETMYVYIEKGLRVLNKPTIRVLEMGFGTGLNAVFSALEAAPSKSIYYRSIEAYPIEDKTILTAIKNSLPNAWEKALFTRLHQAPWHKDVAILDEFTIHKEAIPWEDYSPKTDGKPFDIVFYDAFAPHAQPHLWSEASLKKAIDSLAIGGIFITYCAQGEMKRILKRNGMEVETLPGPPGKREITRATKQNT